MPRPAVSEKKPFREWLRSALDFYSKDDTLQFIIHFSENKIESLFEHLSEVRESVLIRVVSPFEQRKLRYQTEFLQGDIVTAHFKAGDDRSGFDSIIYLTLPNDPMMFFNDVFEWISAGTKNFMIFTTARDLAELLGKMEGQLFYMRKNLFKMKKKPSNNLSYSVKSIYHKMREFKDSLDLYALFLSGSRDRLGVIYREVSSGKSHVEFGYPALSREEILILGQFHGKRSAWDPRRLWEILCGLKKSDAVYSGFGVLRGLSESNFRISVNRLINLGILVYHSMGTRLGLSNGFTIRDGDETG